MKEVTDIPTLPIRDDDSHKGTFGKALIIAGSMGMSGAAILAGRAALRCGTGLVSIACPRSILSIVASAEPSYMTVPLGEDADGKIAHSTPAAQENIVAHCESVAAVAIGPGLGKSRELWNLMRNVILRKLSNPMVIDADAINNISADELRASKGSRARILTPHPGELSRLVRIPTTEIQQNRVEIAARYANGFQSIIVLKGYETIVTDGKRLYVNQTGNAGMATGGTGDVLTGVITGLLAQGMDAFDAAVLGVWIHGRAGDRVRDRISAAGLIASDLPDEIGHVCRELEK